MKMHEMTTAGPPITGIAGHFPADTAPMIGFKAWLDAKAQAEDRPGGSPVLKAAYEEASAECDKRIKNTPAPANH